MNGKGVADRSRHAGVSASFRNQMIYSANFQVSRLRIARGAKFKAARVLLYCFTILISGCTASPTAKWATYGMSLPRDWS
jgi:hypothetical protein